MPGGTCPGAPAAGAGAVFPISRDWSRSGIKSCNPKNQIRDHPEKKWYLSQSGCGIKSGINTTFLARNCGSVAPRAANSSCPLVVLASTNTCPRGSAPMTLSTNVFSERSRLGRTCRRRSLQPEGEQVHVRQRTSPQGASLAGWGASSLGPGG
jgi:hypothetical protein